MILSGIINLTFILSRINLTADPSRSAYVPVDVKGKTKLLYTVKDGDNLGFISEWYRVGLSDLRYWNNIYRNTIRVGQKLAIYVDPSKSDYYSKVNTMTFAEKQQMIGKTVTSNPVATALLSCAGWGLYNLYCPLWRYNMGYCKDV